MKLTIAIFVISLLASSVARAQQQLPPDELPQQAIVRFPAATQREARDSGVLQYHDGSHAGVLVNSATAADLRVPQPPQSLPTVEPLPEPQPSVEMLQQSNMGPPAEYSIARHGTATMEDAFRTFVAMAAEQGRVRLYIPADFMSYPDLAETMCRLGLIQRGWSFDPQQPLTREMLAYMAASYMGCRPGLLTGLLGMTPRYAYREMQFQKLMAQGSPNTLASGSELLSVATRIAARTQPQREPGLTRDEIH